MKSVVIVPTYTPTPQKKTVDAETQTMYHPRFYERVVLARDVLKGYYYGINNTDQNMGQHLRSYMERVNIFETKR